MMLDLMWVDGLTIRDMIIRRPGEFETSLSLSFSLSVSLSLTEAERGFHKGYRNDTATGLAVGDEPESMYMVASGTHYNDQCCALLWPS